MLWSGFSQINICIHLYKMKRYDAQGTVIGLSDGNGNRTRFAVDEWGRITEIHNPNGGVESYTYDNAGNITSTTDANGGTNSVR